MADHETPTTKLRHIETVADAKLLLEKKEAQYKLHIETSHRGVILMASIEPVGPGDFLDEKTLLGILADLKVTVGIREDAVRDFCERACKGETIRDMVLAKGEDPGKGSDQHIDFFKLPSTEKPRCEKDEYGNIDYYNLHLFDNVQPGDVIGILKPPGQGAPGLSVMGEPIPAPLGIALKREPKAGPNVGAIPTAEGVKFVAKLAGRVEYEMDMISVTDKYVIKDGVGFNVGHVDFVGHVEIKGDIQNDFNVRAGKSLKIKGNIGSSRIEAGGDIEVEGVSGNQVGTIICGGSINARFLNDVTVECKGDVLVKNEIINSRVKCGGAIMVNMGSIVGGECMALSGIEAKVIGSETGVKTKITCGTCFMAEAKKSTIHEKLDPLAAELEKLSKKLEPIIKNPKNMAALSPKDRELVKEQAKRLHEIMPECKKLQDELDVINADVEKRGNAIITAREILERGVDIYMGGIKESTFIQLARPLSIIRHSRQSALRYTSRHPITDNARQIEADIVRQEDEEAKAKAARERSEKQWQ
ncbi:MAG TPA: hypothetical protein DCP51_10125 [Clostridiales bacterium]|nr:MAG: hypothetical protein A2X49_08450 [Lentisphaerae bacterium GWF2_52_8]HAN22005.1 hypothetical protein [Clostridiales bacterium]